MFSYFKNRKTTYFDVFCLNFSIETKIKTIFQISYFNLSKKTKWHFGYTDCGHPFVFTEIEMIVEFYFTFVVRFPSKLFLRREKLVKVFISS